MKPENVIKLKKAVILMDAAVEGQIEDTMTDDEVLNAQAEARELVNQVIEEGPDA